MGVARRRLLQAMALPALAAAAGDAAAQPARRDTPARDFAPLGKFFADLQALERRRRRSPVVVLQLGDSHTANDAFSAGMREALQARFGHAGRGFLPPGIPFRAYNPTQVSVAAGSEWRAVSSMESGATGPFGITGLRQRAQGLGAEWRIEGEPGSFAQAHLEILRQPHGGRLRVEMEGAPPAIIPTDGPERRAAFVPLRGGRHARRLRITAMGPGPVDLMGIDLTRGGAGVAYANHGTIGASIALTTRWDRAAVATEMLHLKPSLLVVAFGTNEGFNPGLAIGDYQRLFTTQVRMLSGAAPTASVLVVGPPDGLVRNGAEADMAACERGEMRPPHLRAVREAQRRAAAQEGWYFWDWSAAMGGECSILRWARAEPSLALGDLVHLRTAGARRTAGQLITELMDGYGRGARRGRR